MKCANCGKEVVSVAGKETKLYCDDKCRMQYKRQHRTESTPNNEQISTPNKPVAEGEYPVRYMTDSTGGQHQVDFADRRRIQKLVDGGSFKQLSDDYNLIKNYNLKYFLGYTDVDTVDDLRRPADNKVNLTTAELEHNQRILSKRDADVRAKISATPLDKLITKGSFIPVWRLAQG